jgi:hypothetical protein
VVPTNTDQGWNFAENYPPFSSRGRIGMAKPSSRRNTGTKVLEGIGLEGYTNDMR